MPAFLQIMGALQLLGAGAMLLVSANLLHQIFAGVLLSGACVAFGLAGALVRLDRAVAELRRLTAERER